MSTPRKQATKPRTNWHAKSPQRRAPHHRRLNLEALEDRTLLATATLDINNSTGLLTYVASSGVANALSVSVASSTYTFTDLGEGITLGAGAVADNWKVLSANSVAGPATAVKSISINTLDGNDSVTLASVTLPTSVAFTNSPGNADAVTLGGASSGAQGITGNVTITNSAGTTALTVNDAGDTKAETAFLSGGQLANLMPALVFFGSANLSSLTIDGGTALSTLNVNANDQGPVAVTGGATTGSGTITIGSSAPINYASVLAVNITNAADQPLTQVTQTVTTSTSDVPTAGKAFTYLTTTFADADPQSKTTNFVASIDWGDGSAPISGSITADGAGHFQVSGSHTYVTTGSFPIVTTITDTGSTDSFGISGIAVTIADFGGGALSTGSVAQQDLVSSPNVILPVPGGKFASLINPWGMATDANGKVWAANEGSGSAIYLGPGGSIPIGSTVVIPSASGVGTGSPVGIVFNSSSSFTIDGQPSVFLYSTLDGTISGWNGQLPMSGSPSAVIAVNNSASNAEYTGLAIGELGNQSLLYAANFHSGQVEVFNSQFQLVNEFTDPNLPAGYSPYNIENLGGNLYVTFAKQPPSGKLPVSQLGAGFVDIFSPSGTLIQQLIKGAPLDAPWGLALAPASAGQFAGDLLVANQGNGQVSAFDPMTGISQGAFEDANGQPITNVGLNGLIVAPSGTIYFTSAPIGRASGLWGNFMPTPVSVTIEPATMAATFAPITAVVGHEWQGVVATFTDANIYALPTDFTATVHWGDGSSDTSGDGKLDIIQADGIGSSFLVQGIHTYQTSTTGQQPEIPNITITDDSGNSVFAQSTATVSAPTVHPTVAGFTAVVGEPYTGTVATFTDDAPDPNIGDYSATIDWGDGKTTAGAIALSNQAGQTFIVTNGGSHVYLNATTGQTAYVVTVTITKHSLDTYGNPVTETGQAKGNITVSDPTLHATLTGFAGFVGEPYTGSVATFTDDAPDLNVADYKATIHWGDLTTSVGVITPTNSAGQSFVVTDGGIKGVLHSYAAATTGEEPYVVTVSITKTATDSQGNPLDESAEAVGNVAVSLPTLHTTFSAFAPVAGTTYASQVAAFTDDNPVAALENNAGGNPGLYYTATINWGDTTSSVGTIVQTNSAAAAFIVTGVHTYAAPSTGASPYVVTVSVSKTASGEYSNAVVNVSVGDALLFPFTQNVALTTAEGTPFTGAVAQFTDNNSFVTPANFNGPSASQTVISWGDGKSSVGTIVVDPKVAGVFDVVGTHTYATPTLAGIPNTVSVSIVDQWGGRTTVTNSMAVTAAALTFTNLALPINPAVPIIEGKAFTSDVSLFTSANPNATAGEYSATITWGDATPVDLGTVKEDGTGIFHVTGSHTYLAPGVFTINIRILVTGGTIFLDPITATVSDASIQYTPPNAAVTKDVKGATIMAGAAFTVSMGNMTDSDPNSSPADFIPTDYDAKTGTLSQGILINWGDPSKADSTGGTITPTASPGQSYAITGSHTYADAGNFLVTVTIADADGSTSTNSFAITVAPAMAAAPKVKAVNALPLGKGLFLTAGVTFTSEVATFTTTTSMATPSNFSATVDWGDGEESAGTIIQGANDNSGNPIFFVVGTHVYDIEESYTFTVSVSTPAVAPETGSNSATVGGAPLVAQSAPIAGTQGTALPDDTVVATFVDTSPVPDPTSFAADTQATVNWGDDTADDDVSAMFVGTTPAGYAFVVQDAHEYKNITDVFQAFQVQVSVVTPDGSAAVVTDLAQMTVPVLTDQPLALTAGTALTTPVAMIHVAGNQTTASDFSATVQWGDGTSSGATVEPDGAGTIAVLGTHTYAQPGSYAMAITLSDAQGNTVTNTRDAVVSNPPAPAAVPLAKISTISNNRHKVVRVVLAFSAPIDSADAQLLKTYRLVAAGKGGSFTARTARVIKLRSAVYDAVDNSVTLTASKPFLITKPTELFVGGQARAIIGDSHARGVTAAAAPMAKTAIREKTVPATGARPAVMRSSAKMPTIDGALVDALLDRNSPGDLRQSRRHKF